MSNPNAGASWNSLPAHAPRPGNKLADRVAVVYGGGSAGNDLTVGQAAAYAYACAGAKVVIVDINLANAGRTQRRLEEVGGQYLVLEADITDTASVKRATEAAIAAFGRIDILHNNVGMPQIKDFIEFDDGDWLHGMQLNCLGAATTIRTTLPYLLANRSGAIINVSSVASIRHTGMNYSVYSASKAALNQLTVTVALEYADRGIRANAILPGLLDTGIGRTLAAIEKSSSTSRAERSPTKPLST
jgi:NAD(P)-dependent dehydrogenase (short-subunit alcohol dehydrogenase family)